MWHKTRATELLKIKYPIIQGPFGGRFSTAELVATVSNGGGLGSFGLNSYAPDEIPSVNERIQQLTQKPYALNLWVPLNPDPASGFSQEEFSKLKELFKPRFEAMQVALPDTFNPATQNFDLQVEAILTARPPVVSFIFGIPSQEIIREFKGQKTITMATATSPEEALKIEAAGIDLIVLSGMEAGGHRGSFLKKGRRFFETNE